MLAARRGKQARRERGNWPSPLPKAGAARSAESRPSFRAFVPTLRVSGSGLLNDGAWVAKPQRAKGGPPSKAPAGASPAGRLRTKKLPLFALEMPRLAASETETQTCLLNVYFAGRASRLNRMRQRKSPDLQGVSWMGDTGLEAGTGGALGSFQACERL